MSRLQRIGGWPAVGAALGAGALMALCYPGVSWYALAPLAWLPLLPWLREPGRVSVRGAALLGLLAGTVLHAWVFYWIVGTLETMSGLPTPVAIGGLLAYAFAMGTHQAAAAGLIAWDARLGLHASTWPLRAGLYLLAAEVVIPFQFPWYFGNVYYLAPLWHQAADLVGVVGLSAITLALSGWIYDVLRGARRRHAMVSATVLVAAWAGYGALRLSQVQAASVRATLPTLLVQHNPSLAEKRSLKPGPRLPMFERARKLTRDAGVGDAKLVVWSEGALPFFYVPSEADPLVKGRANSLLRRTTREADALGAELGVPFLFGTLRRLDPSWGERARNSGVLIRPGQPRWVYDKRILVPFGERMPLRDAIPALRDAVAGVSDLGEGDGPAVVSIAGVRVGMSICYENLFADHVWSALGEADVLLNLTDDVWFGDTNAPELHLMVQSARSVEMRRPLLRATATGVTAHVDAAGVIRGRTPVMQATTLRATAEVRDVDSPFRHGGPWPARGLTVFALAGLLWAAHRSRKKSARSRPLNARSEGDE